MSSEKTNAEEVPIHIDRKKCESPRVTTGADLYRIGGAGAGLDLFRETRGQGDDEFIANDATVVTVEPGDHFYTAQTTLNPGAGRSLRDR